MVSGGDHKVGGGSIFPPFHFIFSAKYTQEGIQKWGWLPPPRTNTQLHTNHFHPLLLLSFPIFLMRNKLQLGLCIFVHPYSLSLSHLLVFVFLLSHHFLSHFQKLIPFRFSFSFLFLLSITYSLSLELSFNISISWIPRFLFFSMLSVFL